MNVNTNVMKIINEFSMLEEIVGILLAGSYVTKTNDKDSDYDIYIYVSKEIPLGKRKIISDKFCSYMELNNTFWETEDDGILKESNIPIEIIYRDLSWIESSLNRTLVKCEADVGYTTCFWSNFLNSIILYDKGGYLKRLQKKYMISYPEKLKQNIIKKNYGLLKLKMPSYYYQIEKALKRDDFISVNHRIAAFLASYFDIIFAINEVAHPGEKKILKIIKDKNLKTPKDMKINIKNILEYSVSSNRDILFEIDILINNLDILLKSEGFNINAMF
ncbi:nucleotidyltransferase domain-containing protein [Clostridium uliginosum]|uniref:Nucleotidyltransferase domain-containing protein n=1 Tax=Clostridium uliginosum TaxID=119641 RepID=A0A1I1LBT5_9CLOT|nr:nucleotidyltransferase domain-containing protein [Clostridium uliginosum]SFC68468.1 Nucleotidyltransferase domain-containing protein [Clostridium uliginosum]